MKSFSSIRNEELIRKKFFDLFDASLFVLLFIFSIV